MTHWKRFGWIYMGGTGLVNVFACVNGLLSPDPEIGIYILNGGLAILMFAMAYGNYQNGRSTKDCKE